MSNAKAREEEYLRRMKERGYIPSLAGMDDDDIEWALERMDRRQEEPQAPQLDRTYRPPDRDFAERMFRMFARPFDPNWKMPNLDGPEFRQPDKPGLQFEQAMGGAKRPDWGGGEKATVERTLRYLPGGDDARARLQPMSMNVSGGVSGPMGLE